MKQIGIIGVGKMGSAIARGLANAGWNISLYDRHPEKIETFATQTLEDPNAVITHSDIVIIAVKPQSFAELCQSIDVKTEGKLIISIMAGIPLSVLADAFPNTALIRSMPNLGVQVDRGMTAWIGRNVSDEHRGAVQELFRALGKEMELQDEAMIDSFTALAGSGPAYFFLLTSLLEQKATDLGFSQEDAKKLATEVLAASGLLLEQGSRSAQEWKEAVASKGGTTEAALNLLATSDFENVFFAAIDAAKRRSQELSNS